jgi:hypothetical protein
MSVPQFGESPLERAQSTAYALAARQEPGHDVGVSTVEEITAKVRAMPAELQKETLHYVDFLVATRIQAAEVREWARFSGEQLARQYTGADAMYDED